MREARGLAVTASFVFIFATSLVAQRGVAPAQPVPPPPPPPATKLEGFKPAAGSIVTIGYDELGKVSDGISVDVRDMRDAHGGGARGLLVEVTQSEYRKEQSFVDADEIPELLKGLDALLEVKANPTQFKNFEVRYATRGDLHLVAFNNSKGTVQYAIEAGRMLKAQKLIDGGDMIKLRALFDAALTKLYFTSGK